MPAHRLPRPRRPVVVLCALLLGVLGLLVGSSAGAIAHPYADDYGPVLTLPEDVTFVLGRPGDSYLIEAGGDPVPAIGVDRLPPGLRLVAHGDGSATIVGTATGPAGTTTVAVQAQSSAGWTSELVTVTVQQAPAFVDRRAMVFAVGEPASVRVRTVGYPVPGIGVDGDLPGGLTFVDNGDGTATIAGTAVDGPASTPVTLTAVNVVSNATWTSAIQVVTAPVPANRPRQPTGGPRRAVIEPATR